ncbi:hypothetical protein [Alkalibacillus haloalkaliphilus]|uniref:hypothetical protein n=1 Tax=Alkalibacillus haloalkaliphilus TaxID=94136 RepID=UPI0002D6172C|nr:hypothetical protein [Alkalibacillus haloalkaliphilus]
MPHQNINRKKLILLVVLFIILLSALRLGWLAVFHNDVDGQPLISEGELDLRDWDGLSSETIDLDGEWSFLPGKLATSGQTETRGHFNLVNVPGDWNDRKSNGSLDYYGTYTLRIIVEENDEDVFSLVVPSVRNASQLYVNGRLIDKSGQVSESESQYFAKNIPYTASFTADEDGVIEIMLQVANYIDPSEGGIARSIKFGESSQVRSENLISYSMQLIVMVAFLIYATFAIGLFFVNERNGTFINASFLILCAIVTHSLGSDEKLLTYWFQLDYEWNIRVANLASTGMIFSLGMIVKGLFGSLRK